MVNTSESEQSRGIGKKAPEWLADPDIVVFAGDAELAVGASEQHALGDWVGGVFGRSKKEVQEDWDRVIHQVGSLAERASLVAGDYEMQEISFELGFSAEGRIVFVAKAGITTTIRATFRRKSSK